MALAQNLIRHSIPTGKSEDEVQPGVLLPDFTEHETPNRSAEALSFGAIAACTRKRT